MQGKIIKGIAGFYYVHVDGQGTYECRAKGIFRKDGVKPLVGDDVLVDVLDDAQMTGNIREILPRRNALLRPAVANVDQALVIFAIVKPQPNFNLLDRFLIRMERQGLPTIICFNKQDIASAGEKEALRQAYGICGCRVLFFSALENEGVEEIRAAGEDHHRGGAKRRGQVVADQQAFTAGRNGDGSDQQEDRAGQTYHAPFGDHRAGGGVLYHGYAGLHLTQHRRDHERRAGTVLS